MSRIVIFGAGDVGAETARRLAAADVAPAIAIVDDQAAIAQGKALDIAQAAPVDRYTTAVTGGSDPAAAIGARIIVLADRAEKPAVEWRDDPGLALVKRVAGYNAEAPILCAGVQQASIVDRAVAELGLPRMRMIGTSAEALRSAIVSLVALEAGAAPPDVNLAVAGRAPQPIIVPWDEVTIAGQPAPRVLSPAQIARLEQRIARVWPPGPYALAAAAARLIRTMLMRVPHVHAALVAVTREEGTPGRTAILPVALGPRGITRVIRPALASRDQVRLENILRS